jgi:hypothetical protein
MIFFMLVRNNVCFIKLSENDIYYAGQKMYVLLNNGNMCIGIVTIGGMVIVKIVFGKSRGGTLKRYHFSQKDLHILFLTGKGLPRGGG